MRAAPRRCIVGGVCPCGSGVSYDACCAPLHRGQASPASAEALMRARYAAFVRREHGFLWRTLHRDHEDRAGSERSFLARLAAHAERARYRGLRVIDADGPDGDGVWRVLFHVRASIAGRDASFVELSSFAADDEAPLKYVGGVTRSAKQIPRSIAELEGR